MENSNTNIVCKTDTRKPELEDRSAVEDVEISKEKEDELLYPMGDGNEKDEELLSDDSLRLIFSEDEECPVNNVTTNITEQKSSTEIRNINAETLSTPSNELPHSKKNITEKFDSVSISNISLTKDTISFKHVQNGQQNNELSNNLAPESSLRKKKRKKSKHSRKHKLDNGIQKIDLTSKIFECNESQVLNKEYLDKEKLNVQSQEIISQQEDKVDLKCSVEVSNFIDRIKENNILKENCEAVENNIKLNSNNPDNSKPNSNEDNNFGRIDRISNLEINQQNIELNLGQKKISIKKQVSENKEVTYEKTETNLKDCKIYNNSEYNNTSNTFDPISIDENVRIETLPDLKKKINSNDVTSEDLNENENTLCKIKEDSQTLPDLWKNNDSLNYNTLNLNSSLKLQNCANSTQKLGKSSESHTELNSNNMCLIIENNSHLATLAEDSENKERLKDSEIDKNDTTLTAAVGSKIPIPNSIETIHNIEIIDNTAQNFNLIENKLLSPSLTTKNENENEPILSNNLAESQTKILSSSIKDSPILMDNQMDVENKKTKNFESQNPSVDRKEKIENANECSTSDDNKINNNDKTVITRKRKRRTRKTLSTLGVTTQENQGKENGRQRRQTAKNAEEIIRNNILNQNNDSDLSDNSEMITVRKFKTNSNIQDPSLPLKRSSSENDIGSEKSVLKKLKVDHVNENNLINGTDIKNREICKLNYVREFFKKGSLFKFTNLTHQQLEELLLQKIVEVTSMRGEIGKLREQARMSKKIQEATRAKCHQLTKQVKDLEMVLNKNSLDRKTNNDKLIAPIKINRSVGLQVNFMTEQGIQNLRQIQQNVSSKLTNDAKTVNTETNVQIAKNKIKMRSPRQQEVTSTTPIIAVPGSQITVPSLISPRIPTALVVTTKPIEIQNASTSINQSPSSNANNSSPQQHQTIVVNGRKNQNNRSNTSSVSINTKTSDLIDLTDEEEKKSLVNSTTVTPNLTTDKSVNFITKSSNNLQKVIQSLPGAIRNQSSITVVQPASQPTPTALVNNMNTSRVTYVMQNAATTSRQVLITTSSQIQPVNTKPAYQTVYKTGIQPFTNGTVRVLTTTNPKLNLNRHPAPLPDIPSYQAQPGWKLPPPPPSLKISKVENGIVLSWNIPSLNDKHAEIVSYQLYAYQEMADVLPTTNLWKKVGDVRALPLPMACTLTQFSKGNNYYFAVRAVDTHSRKGHYSIPGNICL